MFDGPRNIIYLQTQVLWFSNDLFYFNILLYDYIYSLIPYNILLGYVWIGLKVMCLIVFVTVMERNRLTFHCLNFKIMDGMG